MDLKKIFIDNGFEIKEQKYNKNIKIFKINNKINLVNIIDKTSSFKIERDLFFYLNSQTVSYAFILENENGNKIFYIHFKDKRNWLASSFDTTDKKELYFGKIVLNSQIEKDDLVNKLIKLIWLHFDSKNFNSHFFLENSDNTNNKNLHL